MPTMTIAGRRQMSQAGIDQLIKPHEGYVLRAYLCPAKVWTIGFGHTGRDVRPGMVITKAQAEQLLDQDLRRFEELVDRFLGWTPTTQGEFDAMVSLCYNIGPGSKKMGRSGFETSSVLRRHKLGQKKAAAEAFKMWNKGGGRVLPGLVKRRAHEANWYLRG